MTCRKTCQFFSDQGALVRLYPYGSYPVNPFAAVPYPAEHRCMAPSFLFGSRERPLVAVGEVQEGFIRSDHQIHSAAIMTAYRYNDRSDRIIPVRDVSVPFDLLSLHHSFVVMTGPFSVTAIVFS